MQVQYVYDENGKKTSVIVPITLWQKILRRKSSASDNRDFDPSRYRGLFRNLGIKIDHEIDMMRQEWERV